MHHHRNLPHRRHHHYLLPIDAPHIIPFFQTGPLSVGVRFDPAQLHCQGLREQKLNLQLISTQTEVELKCHLVLASNKDKLSHDNDNNDNDKLSPGPCLQQ